MAVSIKLGFAFFKSKISRRIFLLFITCAMLPIATISYISFRTIYNALNQQARKELHQMCRSRGLDIFNNLLRLESEIKLISSLISNDTIDPLNNIPSNAIAYFNKMTLFTGGAAVPLFGENVLPAPVLTEQEISHLKIGKVVIAVKGTNVFMIKKMTDGVIVADVKKDFLWPNEPQLHVLSADYRALTEKKLPFTLDKVKDNYSNGFYYSDRGEEYTASYRPMFLKSVFSAPAWIVVMAKSRSEIMQPLETFKRNFILLCLLSFSFVLFLSTIQIRKSLVPIEALKRGTHKIAAGDFKSHIAIKSGDEFEELGESFNGMGRELEEMQAMLVQTEKMKTIGQMSSAIVHEINQPLTAVKGYLDLLLKTDGLSEKAERYLSMVRKTTERIAGIAGKFSRLARASSGEPLSEISLGDSLTMVHEVLEHQLAQKKITFSLNLDDDLPPVMGNEDSLQQVFMNLIVNAMDAIEEGNGSKGSQKKPLIEVRAHSRNGQVVVTVEDNGPGIPVEIREKIFEPFFTTKEKGKGTGLGLAVIKSIIRECDGEIEIKGRNGSGTCFTLSLPVAEKVQKRGDHCDRMDEMQA